MNDLAARTDSYFLKTKEIVGRFGDRQASYAVFMRRPVIRVAHAAALSIHPAPPAVPRELYVRLPKEKRVIGH